jgi:phenylalanyl-tRNA synthetase beta chain
MIISYNWLQSLLPEAIAVEKLSHILTAVGLEVESIEELSKVKGGLKGLVIGKILTAEKLENSDKLQVCTVNTGASEAATIVCGAPNAAAGQTVVVALPGTTIYPISGEPFTIKVAKIRGVTSSGMICAEDEIGLGDSHDGIIVLNEDVAPGTPAAEFYNLPQADYVFEIGLTPNRMDAMSHMGVAKDVCAYLANVSGTTVTQVIPDAQIPNKQGENINIKINILAKDKCKRYACLPITNITVAPSPDWLQQQLTAIGVKTINNVVDITNYILHECGQPLHAFDANAITGNEINVQCLPEGTKFVTLEGKERKLSNNDLMICNANEPMCIAGVFGGIASGVNNDTKSIVLESAWFDTACTRITSMHHGLRTDAAIRFEKGVDVSQTIYALQRAAKLICEITGGTIAGDLQDIYESPFQATTIDITYEYINRLSGANYSIEKIKRILLQLCFGIINETPLGLTLQVPFAKPDVTIPADIVEEIMRIDGIDNVPFTGKISFALSDIVENKSKSYKEQVAQTLVSKGFYELFTNSITSSAYYPEQDKLVRMMNSLSAELDVLRPQMLETGLQSISHNINRKNTDLSLYEFGKTYANYNGKFVEEEQLAMYLTGNIANESWNNKPKAIDAFWVKGMVAAFLEKLGIVVTFAATDKGITINKKKQVLGLIHEVDAPILKSFDIKQSVWHVYIKWAAVVKEANSTQVKFEGIPKYMGVRRDLALVIDKKIQYNDIVNNITSLSLPLLQDINLFDVFESDKLGADKKSYAISLEFISSEKTLTVEEVDQNVQQIVKSLGEKLSITIR